MKLDLRHYWHIVMRGKIPRGTKLRTVTMGGGALARMDYWRSDRTGRKNWRVRSILLPKTTFTDAGAAQWATAHRYPWERIEG